MEHNTHNEISDDTDDISSQVESLLISGEEASRAGDAKSALASFNKAISLDPSSDMAWFNRGVLLEAQQDARGARQAFQICLDVNPNHAPATANLCILLERIGDESGAYNMAVKALEFYPGHPTIVEVMDRCKGSVASKPIESMPQIEQIDQYEQSDVEKVVEETGLTNVQAILDEAVHHDIDENQQLDIDELRSAAEVVVAREEIQERIEVTQPVVEAIPDLPVVPIEPEIENVLDLDAMAEEAKNMIQSGDAKGALALLKPHLKTEASKHAPSWLIAGGAMARLDLEDHAISAIEHAQKLDPSNPKGWFNLGSLKQRKGMLREASTCYSNALREDPSYVKAAEKWAPLAMEIKDPQAYLSAATIIVASNPESPLRIELATTLVELAEGESRVLESQSGLPPTLPEGPEMAKTALDLIGEGETELHARAHTMANNHMESVKIWKGLIQINRNDPEIWRGLAKALYAAGDNTTAEKCSIKANEIEAINANKSNMIEESQTIQSPQPEPATISHNENEELLESVSSVSQEEMMSANQLLARPQPAEPVQDTVPNPQVDLAKAALEVDANLNNIYHLDVTYSDGITTFTETIEFTLTDLVSDNSLTMTQQALPEPVPYHGTAITEMSVIEAETNIINLNSLSDRLRAFIDLRQGGELSIGGADAALFSLEEQDGALPSTVTTLNGLSLRSDRLTFERRRDHDQDQIYELEINYSIGEEQFTESIRLRLDNDSADDEVEVAVSDISLNSQDDAEQATIVLDRAINQISRQQARMGAAQNRLEHNIDNLSTISMLTSRAQGRIVDADYAKSTVELARLQILSNAAQNILAAANQSKQVLLGLLR